MPALRRYTGVVYEALSYATLSPAGRRRANGSLRVASALFGLLSPARPRARPTGCRRARRCPASARWPPPGDRCSSPSSPAHRLVVDLRSGPYAALARVPHAVQVRVLRETDGVRTVVSHDNKWTKGLLARALCEDGARSVRDVAEAGRSVADLRRGRRPAGRPGAVRPGAGARRLTVRTARRYGRRVRRPIGARCPSCSSACPGWSAPG